MSTLLVASTGGHLAQLHRLAPRFEGEFDPDFVWATFDTPQSRSLLEGERVVHMHHTHSRDYRRVLLNAVRARPVLRRNDVNAVISTGSGIALSFLPMARALGKPAHYIESAARSQGPSLTGRLLSRDPGIKLYSQYPGWAGRWRHVGSVFDSFAATTRSPAKDAVRRVVVTLGTIGKYGFRRLLERLLVVLPEGVEVLWQTGATDVQGLPIQAASAIPAAELDGAMRKADVVVAHAGIGSALAALEAGHCPVLVPRRQAYGEHVDDHQEQIASTLGHRGLAIHRPPERLHYEDLVAAASTRVDQAMEPPAFPLDGSRSARRAA